VLTKNAAIKIARASVGAINRRSSTEYVIYAPYYDAQPRGPTTELRAGSYPMAFARRTQKIADIALALLCKDRGIDPADARVEAGYHGTTVEALVAAGIAQIEQARTRNVST
jgi:hypothetical protein